MYKVYGFNNNSKSEYCFVSDDTDNTCELVSKSDCIRLAESGVELVPCRITRIEEEMPLFNKLKLVAGFYTPKNRESCDIERCLFRYNVYGYEMFLHLPISSGECYVQVCNKSSNFGSLYGDIFVSTNKLYFWCPAEMIVYLVNLYNMRDFDGIVNSLNGLIGLDIIKLKILNVDGKASVCKLLEWY